MTEFISNTLIELGLAMLEPNIKQVQTDVIELAAVDFVVSGKVE